MTNVISVERISKAYRIGLAEQKYDTLAATAASWLTSPVRNWRSLTTPRISAASQGSGGLDSKDIHWAVRDVSFSVADGEVIGIIGRNGAGKSTLLKLLSRITHPTLGRAVIHGRVASLLEVGTGFHPELTGRDNVYMNGTILGMKKREIDRKFDEIVAKVQEAKNTPESSGNYHDYIELLKLYDKNNNGTMMLAELENILANLGDEIPKDDVQKLMAELCDPEDEDGMFPYTPFVDRLCGKA